MVDLVRETGACRAGRPSEGQPIAHPYWAREDFSQWGTPPIPIFHALGDPSDAPLGVVGCPAAGGAAWAVGEPERTKKIRNAAGIRQGLTSNRKRAKFYIVNRARIIYAVRKKEPQS